MEKIITKDGSLAEVEGSEYLHSLRHTASHIMATVKKFNWLSVRRLIRAFITILTWSANLPMKI